MVDNQSNPSEGQPNPSPAAGPAGASRSEASASQTASSAGAGEIARLQAELAEAKDRALRALAELENFRKRANRQIDEERRYAPLPLMRDLLPVTDNMKRAIEAAENTHDTASLLEGIKMVVQQFGDVLARHHCTPIAALHRPFDPNVHAAILHQPSTEFPPNTVIHEVHQGFQLHDRVVRPSQVIVSSPAEPRKAEPSTSEDAKPQ